MGTLFQRGFLDHLDDQRYIVMNPADLSRAVTLLNAHVQRAYRMHIDYNIHLIAVEQSELIALCSANPKFHIGSSENQFLHQNGVKNFLVSSKGVSVDAKTIEHVRELAGRLGVPRGQPPQK